MIYTYKNVMYALTFMKNINESDIIKSRPVETDCVTSSRKIIACCTVDHVIRLLFDQSHGIKNSII